MSRLVLALSVLACVSVALADDQPSFSIIIAPPPDAPTREELGNWSIMPGQFDAKASQGAPLDFSVFGKSAQPKPVVYIYVGDPRTCVPCRIAKAEIESLTKKQVEELPFRLIVRDPPEWVRATPTLHWSEPDGISRQIQGWPGIKSFVARWESSFQRAETRVESKTAKQ